MLNIFITEFLDPPINLNLIEDVEEGFTRIIGGIPSSSVNKNLISAIDEGEYLDNFFFIDRFGCKQSISNLSTGCKAALSVNNLKDSVISTIECGVNAVNAILHYCVDGNLLLPFDYKLIDTTNTPAAPIRVGDYQFSSLHRLNIYLTQEFPDEPDLGEEGILCL